jgi:hypothetical protein
MQRAIKASVKLQRRTNSVEVPQCPVFRPTPDEFADPFAYIKSITPEGQAAGIVKIIPPEGASDGIPVVPPPPHPPADTTRDPRPTMMDDDGDGERAVTKPKTNTENTERAV